jgi:CDP-glycerol glycerophosphotransferase (TagB/SpsB family)
MEKSFFQKLQMVKISDILHIFKFIFAFPIALILKIFIKDLWLVCDYEDEARDNGYYFYKYLREKQKEQNVYYAINKKSPDYEKVKKLGKVVKYGSFKHWILYLLASKNISSQKGGKPNAAICYVLEVYGIIKNKRIFLQHGIIKDNLPYLHYKNAKLSMFTVTTKKEYDYVCKEFGYPEGVIQQLGLCRYDTLIDESDGEYILIMPTWRQWIAHETTNSKKAENFKSFKETNYYKKWMELLSSKELEKVCKNNNKKIIFYPHRNMQKFINDFELLNKDYIIIGSWPEYDVQDLLKKSSLLITDYSSVAMDFAYLDKPIIYYQFDYEQFRSWHLEEGYFSYKDDGFGYVKEDLPEIIRLIEFYINNNFELENRHKNRINDFFDLKDNKNCERTYLKIKEI